MSCREAVLSPVSTLLQYERLPHSVHGNFKPQGSAVKQLECNLSLENKLDYKGGMGHRWFIHSHIYTVIIADQICSANHAKVARMSFCHLPLFTHFISPIQPLFCTSLFRISMFLVNGGLGTWCTATGIPKKRAKWFGPGFRGLVAWQCYLGVGGWSGLRRKGSWILRERRSVTCRCLLQ